MKISKRYIDDGRATLRLNDLQTRLRDQVAEKVALGLYKFENTVCCVCGDDAEMETLAEKDRYGLKLPVVICSDCGLIFSNPRMNQDSYASFYNSEYRELYHGHDSPIDELFTSGLKSGKRIARFLSEMGKDLRQKRILEVGCGAGGILAHFRDHYDCDVVGCDFGSEGIRYGVENHSLSLQVGDLDSVTLQWKPDIVIYSHVFEHILDLNAECTKVKDRLHDEGYVYIEVPSVKNIRNTYGWDFLRLLQNAHTYHFTLKTLQNVMTRNGFRLQAGNEFVKALFVKGSPNMNVENDHDDVMRFLTHTERLRSSYEFARQVKALVVRFLGVLGLSEITKRILGKA